MLKHRYVFIHKIIHRQTNSFIVTIFLRKRYHFQINLFSASFVQSSIHLFTNLINLYRQRSIEGPHIKVLISGNNCQSLIWGSRRRPNVVLHRRSLNKDRNQAKAKMKRKSMRDIYIDVNIRLFSNNSIKILFQN